MNKRIFVALVAIALIVGLIWYQEKQPNRVPEKIFNEKVEYSTKSYLPFDTKFAFDAFKKNAKKGFKLNANSPGDSTNVTFTGNGKLMVVMSPYFLPTQYEVNKLLDFVELGNDLYVSSFTIASPFLNSVIGRDSTDSDFEFIENYPPQKTFGKVKIYFPDTDSIAKNIYTYPGKRFKNPHGNFLDEKYGKTNLALEATGDAALIKVNYGEGNIFINFCPATMGNYFLLHKQNYQFFNEVYSRLGAANKSIVWDTFYAKHTIQRPEPTYDAKPGESYLWKLIGQFPTLGWAVFTFFLAICLFVLVYARRTQKPVAVIKALENNSVEFVNAVSGLYWLKQDHKKIADKISQQFYDYLATNYRIPYQEMTLDKAEKIAQKSGKSSSEIVEILSLIKEIEMAGKINPNSLSSLYTKVFACVN